MAAFVFGTAVAKTIGSGLIDVKQVDSTVILTGLLGAILWDLYTWWAGLPTSSSHALIGGYARRGHRQGGLWRYHPRRLDQDAAIHCAGTADWLDLRRPVYVGHLLDLPPLDSGRHHNFFRHGQLLSAAAYSLGHGTNDAQKTMGIIAGLLFASGSPLLHGLVADEQGQLFIPLWIVLMAHAAIALGTMSGGWRIVHTMGSKITKLKPMGGFAAELAGAITLFGSAQLGIPVSTTHTITGAIVGVGSMRRLTAVRLGCGGADRVGVAADHSGGGYCRRRAVFYRERSAATVLAASRIKQGNAQVRALPY